MDDLADSSVSSQLYAATSALKTEFCWLMANFNLIYLSNVTTNSWLWTLNNIDNKRLHLIHEQIVFGSGYNILNT